MKKENEKTFGYYKGHYIDSGKTHEERILAEKIAQEESDKLTEWPDENEDSN